MSGEQTMKTIETVVARGRTVMHDGKPFGPGSTVHLSAADAERLIVLGYVHRPGEAPTIAHVVPMVSTPEGMTAIGKVSEHEAVAADRGRFFTKR